MIDVTNFNAAVQMIRVAVFQQEQGFAADLEFDGQDAIAQHLLATWASQPVGTMRLRTIAPGVAKLERVAVLRQYRSRGVGRAMIESARRHLRQQGIQQIKLNAQVSVVDFYTALGFVVTSDVFEAAGIPHVAMVDAVAHDDGG